MASPVCGVLRWRLWCVSHVEEPRYCWRSGIRLRMGEPERHSLSLKTWLSYYSHSEGRREAGQTEMHTMLSRKDAPLAGHPRMASWEHLQRGGMAVPSTRAALPRELIACGQSLATASSGMVWPHYLQVRLASGILTQKLLLDPDHP